VPTPTEGNCEERVGLPDGDTMVTTAQMARILSISYDATLLATRELLLQQMGHTVVSAEGFAKAYATCAKDGKFNLIVLGHSIPHDDKVEIVQHCVTACSCPVLALLRPNESILEGAARSVDSSQPEKFLRAVNELVGRKSN
jgi:CheY-like chemotaxis protein